MLLITRNVTQSFFIGDDIKVTVCNVNGKQVKIGIDAPKNVQILREEIRDQYDSQGNKRA